MKVLITGASSGIGEAFTKYLSNIGYYCILIGRNEDKLKELVKITNSEYLKADLSKEEEVYNLYNKYPDIDMLINSAGIGYVDNFEVINLKAELKEIDINIKAVHILTKLYYESFIKKNYGYILNVGSSAGFMAGPLMATYYATKNYVVKLTSALHTEAKKNNYHINISCLCPGPIDTNFNTLACVTSKKKLIKPESIIKESINGLLKNKMFIVPTFKMKLGLFFNRFLSYKTQNNIVYKIQKGKKDEKKI